MNGSAKRQKNLSHRPFIHVLLFLSVVLCLISVIPVAAADYWPDAQWRTATPESQGMRSEVLADMLDLILRKDYNIDSILVIRNGYAVLDAYGCGNNTVEPEHIHNIYSCTKSVMSALIGIAIDKGYIQSVDQRLLEFFPEKKPKNPDRRKRAITLEHLLMMAPGLKCQDSYIYKWRGLMEMERSGDWVQHMLDLPMLENPGTRFEYCNGSSFLLSAILQKATGKTAEDFAMEHLFAPLGIDGKTWLGAPNGITKGYSALYLRPRDMAKFGYLFLKNGKWKDRQIVPAEWVARSTRKHLPATMRPGYGYQWWVTSPDRYVAIGYAGQRIFILKDKQMVVVFTSRLDGLAGLVPDGLVNAFIVPSAVSEGPLPEDPQATERLRQLDAICRTATISEKIEWRKRREEITDRPKMNIYVNDRYGFSVTVDPDLLVRHPNLPSPFVFRISDPSGLPSVSGLAAEIPPGLALENSEQFVLRNASNIPEISDVEVRKKEVIRLSDGQPANYFEMKMKHQTTALVSAGVIGYKKNTLIGVFATGLEETPQDYLKKMVTSLKLKP